MVFFQFVQLHLLAAPAAAAARPSSFYPPTWLDSLLAASPSLLRYNHVMKIIRTIGPSSPPLSLPYPIHLSACFSSSSLSTLPSLIEMIRSKLGIHSTDLSSRRGRRRRGGRVVVATTTTKRRSSQSVCCFDDVIARENNRIIPWPRDSFPTESESPKFEERNREGCHLSRFSKRGIERVLGEGRWKMQEDIFISIRSFLVISRNASPFRPRAAPPQPRCSKHSSGGSVRTYHYREGIIG